MKPIALIKLFYLPFILMFFIIAIALSIFNVFNKGYESELATWKTLLHEQQKITHLTSLFDLRSQLKLNLADVLLDEPISKEVEEKFNP